MCLQGQRCKIPGPAPSGPCAIDQVVNKDYSLLTIRSIASDRRWMGALPLSVAATPNRLAAVTIECGQYRSRIIDIQEFVAAGAWNSRELRDRGVSLLKTEAGQRDRFHRARGRVQSAARRIP